VGFDLMNKRVRISKWARPYFRLEEYFAVLGVTDATYEYWEGEIVCVNGGTPEHAYICSNLLMIVQSQLEERGGRAFNLQTAIKTPQLPPFRFPNLSVVCGPPIFEKIDQFHALTNPVVIAEVLSKGTEELDREPKRQAYQALPSLREYLLVESEMPHLTRYARQKGDWRRFDYGDLNAVVELPSIQSELPLREVYRGVEFDCAPLIPTRIGLA
jgi:Uma2 family endonuclease